MNPEVLSSIIVLVIYIALVLGSGALTLWLQRKFFLMEDEGQSFGLPFLMALGVGIIYFWTVIKLDV